MDNTEQENIVEPNDGGVKKKGVMSRNAIYGKIASRADEIIEGLFELTKSTNPSVSLGAYNTLVNKILPDLKAVDLKGDLNGQLIIKQVSYKDV